MDSCQCFIIGSSIRFYTEFCQSKKLRECCKYIGYLKARHLISPKTKNFTLGKVPSLDMQIAKTNVYLSIFIPSSIVVLSFSLFPHSKVVYPLQLKSIILLEIIKQIFNSISIKSLTLFHLAIRFYWFPPKYKKVHTKPV